jgi:hypothetical protein
MEMSCKPAVDDLWFEALLLRVVGGKEPFDIQRHAVELQ